MESLLSTELLSALLGVLIGSAITWRMTHWFDRRRNAADLYAQFCSFEMERVRHDAGRFLRRNIVAETPVSFEGMHCDEYSQELSDVTRLVNFWEKTENLLAYRYVDQRFTRTLLSHFFQSHMRQFLRRFCEISEAKDSALFLQWVIKVRSLEARWDAGVG